jgi:aspartyl-tRNA synthetase
MAACALHTHPPPPPPPTHTHTLARAHQVARCFRDEDLRADRQPEFTQLDIEVAWADRDTIMALMEGMIAAAFAEVAGIQVHGLCVCV